MASDKFYLWVVPNSESVRSISPSNRPEMMRLLTATDKTTALYEANAALVSVMDRISIAKATLLTVSEDLTAVTTKAQKAKELATKQADIVRLQAEIDATP